MGNLMTAPIAVDSSEDRTMILNMGPQHPSTHGVLRLVLEIDGEVVVRVSPDIGFLHTGIEKTCEAKFYQQVVPLTDRHRLSAAPCTTISATAWRSKNCCNWKFQSARSVCASC